MAADALVGASGMAAASARLLIAAALANTAAERVRKFRRESIVVLSFRLIACRAAAVGGEQGLPADAAASQHRHAEIGGGEPKVPCRFDACDLG